MGTEGATVADCLLRKYEDSCLIPYQHHRKQISRKISLEGSKKEKEDPRNSQKLQRKMNIRAACFWAARTPVGVSICPTAKEGRG